MIEFISTQTFFVYFVCTIVLTLGIGYVWLLYHLDKDHDYHQSKTRKHKKA